MTIELSFTSTAYLRQHAAAAYLRVLAASIDITWQPSKVMDERPMRALFKMLGTSDQQRFIWYLTGTVLTRQLTEQEDQNCPMCGQPDTIGHIILKCWVSADTELSTKWAAWAELLEPAL